MKKKVLITGGAGFIGSFIADELVSAGYQVRIYDNLAAQVHGKGAGAPEYLSEKAEFIRADILDADKFYEAMRDVDVLLHNAAAVGVGQSMYQIRHYVEQNSLGAAVILDTVANRKHRLEKMVVASSMSIYGEGKYTCPRCGAVCPGLRERAQMEKGQWDLVCPECGSKLTPVGTDEKKPLNPTSIYAVTKRDHEEAFLAVGKAYRIPTVALRYFNAYGPRQALSNPYTGVCAIFSSRLLNGQAPVIFEDGLQRRDFIHVKDIARANRIVMEKKEADYGVFNVGTGSPKTILEVANILASKICGKGQVQPEVKNAFRAGDIRHCYADTSKIEKTLGFKTEIPFEDGIDDLTEWVKEQVCEDKSGEALKQLKEKGLVD
ncbi:MAG: SDR family NAD(P)-dependent oxidoreductase [Candidatus Omnitrophica bacterium]|nr:SDR family NAD(P)-dependent oxidoreductase [Candidatus Omnitrophota bacterium]